MAKLQIVLRDLTTGAGRTGLAGGLTLRSKVDNFTADLSNVFTEMVGKPGAYTTDHPPTGEYKLYYTGTEEKSFGGESATHGRPLVLPDDLVVIDTADDKFDAQSKIIKNLAAATADGEAVNKGQVYSKSEADAKYLPLAGGTMSGNIFTNGHAITGLDAPATGTEPETKDSAEAKYLPLAGGVMGGDIDMNGNFIDNLPAPADQKHPLRQQDGDTRYAKKGAYGDPVEAMQIYNQFIFRKLPYLIDDPSHAKHPVSLLYLDNAIQALLTGLNPSAYQQSGNIIRVIPSGVQETNKVYKTLALAMTNAESFAAVDRPMIIEIHGNGTGTVETDYNLLPVGTAEEYIHIVGKGNGVILRAAEDTYDGTAGGNIISDIIFDNENEDAVTDFTNKIFYNVKFSNTFGSGNPRYNFTGCIFLGGCSITTAYTFTSCKGEIKDLANDYNILLGNLRVGSYSVIDTNADVRPRRLQGRQGSDIASASSITLGNGNYFVVTGTTTIATISGTDWQDGSNVKLYFQSALTLDTGGGNIVRNTGGGGNYNVTAGEVVEFIYDQSSWIIIE